jgi:hypothetical protein
VKWVRYEMGEKQEKESREKYEGDMWVLLPYVVHISKITHRAGPEFSLT